MKMSFCSDCGGFKFGVFSEPRYDEEWIVFEIGCIDCKKRVYEIVAKKSDVVLFEKGD